MSNTPTERNVVREVQSVDNYDPMANMGDYDPMAAV